MLGKYRSGIQQFLRKGLSPGEIAFGIALGNFVGILPFLGLHTVMALSLAYLLRLNMLIVFLGTQISNPFTFPFILFVSAQVGNLAMHGSFLSLQFTGDISILKSYVLPTITGGILVGLTVSVPSYFITLKVARRYRQ